MSDWKRPQVEHLVPTKWGWLVSYPKNLEIGYNVDIGAFSYIQAEYGVIIEDSVQIGSHCAIYSNTTITKEEDIASWGETVTLKRGCQIGSHSIIMPGVTIGENAIIGARSYIDKDVPANAILIPQQSFRG